MRRRLHRSTLLAVVAATLAACGGGGGADEGGGPDPATVVPASAPFYMELAVEPEGQRREDALAAARKIMRTDDPKSELLDLIGEVTEAEDLVTVDYERDIEPWLGERAGLFLTDPEAEDPPVMIAVAVTDTAKARSTVAAVRREAGHKLRTGTYKGVEYDVDSEGTATGVVEDFLVVSDEPRLKQGVDASKGKSLAESGGYKAAVAGLDDDRVATMYMVADVAFGLSGGQTAQDRQLRGKAQQALNLDAMPPMAMGLVADGDRIALEGGLSLEGGNETYRRLAELGSSAAASLVADAPADAWAAYGVPQVGDMTRSLLSTFVGAAGTAALTDSIRESTGLDLERDLLAWMGDASIFVRGADEATLDGAMVIETTDAGAARRALPKVADALLRYAPGKMEPAAISGADSAFRLAGPYTDKPLILAVGKGRTVVAYGESAARAGLEPAERLGDTAEYKAVTRSLGDGIEPGFYLSMPGVLKVLDRLAAESGPGYAKVRPYLDAFTAIAAGGRREGDRIDSAVAARLK